MFHLDPPPGFQGLRPNQPIQIYQRNLPHWRQDGATYFTTFRLNDALPAEKRAELRRIKEAWEAENPPPRSSEQVSELSDVIGKQSEAFLDAGYGSCLLKEPAHREIMVNALKYFDSEFGNPHQRPRYQLGAFAIMPNHVHAIVHPLIPGEHPLEKIEQSWKAFASREINRMRQSSGNLWFEESFDRIIRDAEHLYRCVQYIGRNPSKAGLGENDAATWVRPEWDSLGWGFRAK